MAYAHRDLVSLSSLLQAKLKKCRATFAVTPLSRELFRIAANILRFDRDNIPISISIEQVNTEPLKASRVGFIIDHPWHFAYHAASPYSQGYLRDTPPPSRSTFAT